MSDYPSQPSFSGVPESVLSAAEADLRAEAAQATPSEPAQPQQQQQQAQPPTPVTPPPQEPVDPQEAERGYLRDKDYRQKTMAVAEERRILEAQRAHDFQQRQQEQQYLQQAQQAINDAQWLEQRLNALRQQNNLPQPGQPTSAEQVQQLLAQREALLEQKFEQRLHTVLQKNEIDRHTFEFDRQIKTFQQQLLKEFPELSKPAYKGVEKVITSVAFAQTPKSWEDAQELMRADAIERVKDIKKTLSDHEQAAIMRHTKQAQPAIEPKGGTAPTVQSPKNVRLGSQQLEDLIMSDLLAEQAAKR